MAFSGAAAARGAVGPGWVRPGTAPEPALATVMLAVMVVAVLMRWLGYTGFFGSDEVTYTERAFLITRGDWTVDEYVGANRLGVNLPVAGFAALFGRTEFAAALWSLVCSLGEVALVTWAGFRLFGARVGLLAGLLLASMPTHIHFAGRLMADAPLALLITASFVFFYEGERRRWPLGWFLAGLCAGLSFWVKPVTLFVFGVFVFWPLVARRIDWGWLWMPVGTAVAMAANGLLFWALTGRFFYIFEVMHERRTSGYLEAGAAAGEIAADPHFYLVYLFAKVYHTGLVGWLALAGMAWLLLAPRRSASGPGGGGDEGLAARFLLFWALGLLLILSVLPVGFNPLMFVPKQTNYMLIFVAPLALLAAVALAGLAAYASRLAALVTGAAIAAGLLLALLLQGAVAVFTANSLATLELAQAQPQARLYVMSNAFRAAQFQQLVGGPDLLSRVRPLSEWKRGAAAATLPEPAERLAVIDPESFDWDGDKPFPKPDAVPACWQRVSELRGEPAGAGVALARWAHAVVQRVPGLAGTGVERRLQRMNQPAAARVYRVPAAAC